jgi:cytochrome P450
MAKITNRITFAGIIAGYFPTWLSDIIIKRTCSLTSALDVIYDNAKPMLDRRLLRKEKQPDWETPQDMLQWIQETPLNNGNPRNTADSAAMLAMVGLVAIHTTSMFSLFALNELAVRPDVVAVLRADIAKAIADNGGVLTPHLTDKLPRLDSFMREILRLNVDVLGHRHIAMQDYAFKNGMIVRKGTLVVVSMLTVHSDPEIQSEDSNKNLDEFDAFRFADIPSKKSYSASPAFIIFGEGQHTCPGRFFAVHEMKYLLASILMKYDVKSASKKRAQNTYANGMSTYPPECPLIFEPISTKQY